jgi:hypothetical protein
MFIGCNTWVTSLRNNYETPVASHSCTVPILCSKTTFFTQLFVERFVVIVIQAYTLYAGRKNRVTQLTNTCLYLISFYFTLTTST